MIGAGGVAGLRERPVFIYPMSDKGCAPGGGPGTDVDLGLKVDVLTPNAVDDVGVVPLGPHLNFPKGKFAPPVHSGLERAVWFGKEKVAFDREGQQIEAGTGSPVRGSTLPKAPGAGPLVAGSAQVRLPLEGRLEKETGPKPPSFFSRTIRNPFSTRRYFQMLSAYGLLLSVLIVRYC